MEQQNMEPWARRVVYELDHLEGRREALCNFLGQSMVSDTLPPEQVKLLEAQHRAMKLYADILRQRLLVGGVEVDAAFDPPAFQDLIVEHVAGQVHISVGVKTLAHAVTVGRYGMRPLSVTDPAVFAGEVVSVLKQEEEDGSTLIHGLFDKAASIAADQGAEGLIIEGVNDGR